LSIENEELPNAIAGSRLGLPIASGDCRLPVTIDARGGFGNRDSNRQSQSATVNRKIGTRHSATGN